MFLEFVSESVLKMTQKITNCMELLRRADFYIMTDCNSYTTRTQFSGTATTIFEVDDQQKNNNITKDETK